MRYDTLIRRTFDVRGTSGSEYLCVCPWHDDKGKPNLYVNGVKGVFHCHACHKSGHLRNITADLPPPSTADLSTRLAALHSPPDDDIGRIYPERWLKRFEFPHAYWTHRGYSEATVSRFDLGYDPMMDRVTIPVRHIDGTLLGVIQRVLDDSKPKYRYPRGFPIRKHLFASWMVAGRQQKVALVEGALDAVTCWDARVPALGLMGSYLTAEKRQMLIDTGVQTVVIFTDNDRPGVDAIYQVQDALADSGLLIKVAMYRTYWSAKDPGELTGQQIRKAYHSAVPWHRWIEMP